MSTENLTLEEIKNEDYIADEDSIYKDFSNSNKNITECGRLFLDIEKKTFNLCCLFCETVFQEVYKLVEHVTETHILLPTEEFEDFDDCDPEPSANCDFLEITVYPEEAEKDNFETKSDDLASINHSTEFPFKCDQCPKTFRTEENLYYHSSVHQGSEMNFKCLHCNQIFVKKRYLQMHLSYHLDEKTFRCTICGKDNRTAYQLKIHMVKHSSKKEYICETCGASYRLRHHLVTHQRQTHENKRNFKCNQCNMAFNTLTFLNNHKISHSKERKHICNICGGGFLWRKNLIEHSKLHSDIKGYKCEICSKTFFQKSGLITHTKSHTSAL